MNNITKILFLVSAILLVINIFGLFKSMRNPEIYTEEAIIRNRIGDVTIEYPEIKELLNRREGESNVDFAVGYERDIIGIGDHRFFAGVRTGFYGEYVLTGNGWSHPEKNRFFLGISPSYMLYFSKNFRMQVNFLYDVLLPDDYDEIWSYWALEASFQYFIGDVFIGISATRGVFLFFDPKAYMVKAGIKLGYRF